MVAFELQIRQKGGGAAEGRSNANRFIHRHNTNNVIKAARRNGIGRVTVADVFID